MRRKDPALKFLKFTYVDAMTGISIASEPATNGPVLPPVAGLEYAWARESRYPTDLPELFGTCPDDSDTAVAGVLGEFSKGDWENMRADEMRARKPAVPQEVTMGQCRLALFDKYGIETDEEFLALTDMLPEGQRARARLELRTRPTVRFDSPLVQGLCAAMGWDAVELFIYAGAQ